METFIYFKVYVKISFLLPMILKRGLVRSSEILDKPDIPLFKIISSKNRKIYKRSSIN